MVRKGAAAVAREDGRLRVTGGSRWQRGMIWRAMGDEVFGRGEVLIDELSTAAGARESKRVRGREGEKDGEL